MAKNDIADRVIRARERLGVTQVGLARMLGCDPMTVSKYENGREPRPGLYRERLEEFLESVEKAEAEPVGVAG